MTKKTKMKFGARLRMHREEIMCWSVRDAAADIGISPATVSRVENGKTPDIFTLAKLCKWMGFSIDQAIIDLGPNANMRGERSESLSMDGLEDERN